jgi:hypothetical protein
MSAVAPLVEAVRIARPCHVSWDAMTGDDRVRFCKACHLNVYNPSAMTRQEAEDLLRRREGRMCLRLYRRADGTVLTRDCPVGLRAAQGKVRYATRLLLAVLLFTLLGAMAVLWQSKQGTTGPSGRTDRWGSLRQHEPFRTVLNWLDPLPPPDPCEMGW